MHAIGKKWATLVGLALLATVGMTACSSNGTPSSAGQSSVQATSPAIAATTAPSTATAPIPSAGASLVPMQAANGGEFNSPSGNISCEIDYNRAGSTKAYCQTATPPASVTMDATGSYTTCSGQQCLGNAGIGTPTLAYGTSTGVGPFVCESTTTGITCTAEGKGFHISSSGITSG